MILIHSIPCVNGAHKPSSLPVLVMTKAVGDKLCVLLLIYLRTNTPPQSNVGYTDWIAHELSYKLLCEANIAAGARILPLLPVVV